MDEPDLDELVLGALDTVVLDALATIGDDTPLVSAPSAGAFTVAVRNPCNGILGGGDLDPSFPNNAATATSSDGGATWTPDDGDSWYSLPGVTGYWAVAFASPQAGWLVGTEGRILTISF
jgi:hypothetical protein